MNRPNGTNKHYNSAWKTQGGGGGCSILLKYYYLKTTALEASKMKRLTIAVFETYIYGMKNHCMVRGGGGGGWGTAK